MGSNEQNIDSVCVKVSKVNVTPSTRRIRVYEDQILI